MNIIEHNKNGLVYLTADGFEAAGGVAHGFSTRLGGVSEGIYATLNLGMNRGDAPDRVREGELSGHLAGCLVGSRLLCLDTIDSTNTGVLAS